MADGAWLAFEGAARHRLADPAACRNLKVTQDELDALRTKFIPTWASLRSIGNSRAVQASVAFPIIGYLILLSSKFTSIFDGGLAGQAQHQGDWWDHLWALKLYYVYFGLLNLGVGSAIYQLSCPRQIKKHGDWEDYVRVDGPSMNSAFIVALGQILGRDYDNDVFDVGGSHSELKITYLRQHYAILSAEAKYARVAVTCFFFSGLGLLSVPSLMTVIKIVVLFIRSSI
jgi:hypothetical protein